MNATKISLRIGEFLARVCMQSSNNLNFVSKCFLPVLDRPARTLRCTAQTEGGRKL